MFLTPISQNEPTAGNFAAFGGRFCCHVLNMRPLPPATLIVKRSIVNHLPHIFYYHKKKGGRNIVFKAAFRLETRNF